MSEEVSIDEAMTRRFELDEQISLIQGRQKLELAPLVEEMQLCEQFVKAELLKTGAQQWKSSSTGHMTFWTTKDSVTVENMEAVIHRILSEAPPIADLDAQIEGKTDAEVWAMVLEHIEACGLWGLLNKAVNKTSVKELIEAGDQPPGIKYTTFRDLSWRRGKVA